MNQPTAKAVYSKLQAERSLFERRAELCAQLTIPRLFPYAGASSATLFEDPFQSTGARGLNNLANKMALALLPPSMPFFRLVLTPEYRQAVAGTQPEGEIEATLAEIENEIVEEIEVGGMRPHVIEAFKQLILAGNVCLYFDKDGGARYYRLTDYVCCRDGMGTLVELVLVERATPDTLPAAAQALAMRQHGEQQSKVDEVEVYTHVKLNRKGKYDVYQEINEQVVPGTSGTYTAEELPYLPLRFHVVDDEDYGRGYIEEFLGDLRSLETLSQAIVEGSAAAARLLFLVKPNGTTRIRDLAEAPNGAYRSGNPEDVKPVTLEKQADLAIAAQTADTIRVNLEKSFLLTSSVQRQAERVTAEEIRLMAGELEENLSGVYSAMALTFQLPLVRMIIARLAKQGRVPSVKDGVFRPLIITGLDALGRNRDVQRMQGAFGAAQALLGDTFAQYVNAPEALMRIFTAWGIKTKGLIKTPEEVAQEQQQQQMQAAALQLAPDAMQLAGKAMSAPPQQPQ